MIAFVAFFNILALVAFALPQKEVVSSATPRFDFSPDGTNCQTAIISLSHFNEAYCRCITNAKCSRRRYSVCRVNCTQWAEEETIQSNSLYCNN